MLVSTLAVFALASSSVLGQPAGQKPSTPDRPTSHCPSTGRPTATASPTASPSPSPTDPGTPTRPPAGIQQVWGTGFFDTADFIEGDYIDGYEYLAWAWALIYRPDNDGTFCLTTYSQEGVAANMVSYVAVSSSSSNVTTPSPYSTRSGALIAGLWSDRTDAACVSGVGTGCVDIWAQHGNNTYTKTGTHCDHGALPVPAA